MQNVQQWGQFEFVRTLPTLSADNPFIQVKFGAVITGPGVRQKVAGFYDGDGTFRVRYMPKARGTYTLTTYANVPELNALTEQFIVVAPEEGNHGPVVVDGLRFRHADGSRFFVMGTTAYVWHHRTEDIRSKTLETFEKYGFNKIRMLFFPKHYTCNTDRGVIDVSREPPCYPFEGEPGAFDFHRPNPEYFRQFEERLLELQDRGILADVILFHPYDTGHWNIDLGMDEDDALLYVRYLVARIASFRNVWWSLANEYDIMISGDRKSMSIGRGQRNWDVIGELIKARDPYGHPISCHNITFGEIYPDRPWMSHVSYQHPDTYTLMGELMTRYQKPVIDDEYQYEGNLKDEWGNCSGELELARHWRSVMAGGYATHGESYMRDDTPDIFWSYGGDMIGTSAPRLKFLKEIVHKCPFDEMVRDPLNSDSEYFYSLRRGTDFFLLFMRHGLDGKFVWAGDWGSPERHTARYLATFYDVWNCVKVREEILPPSSRIPITPWTVVILERLQEEG